MVVTTDRRLSAIMIADVAGFSRLMEVAESQTFARVRRVRDEIANPTVERHGGRVIKTTGDGFLAEFSSSLAALRCGIDIQRAVIALEADQPEATRIRLRIGINVGDIIVDGDDVAGDGVNVAARLEAMAPPDGLCVSSMVHDQIRDDLGVTFEDLGEQRVKNISRPIRAFTVNLGAVSLGGRPSSPSAAWRRVNVRHPKVAIAGLVAVALVVAGGGWYWQDSRAARVGPSATAMSASERAALSVVVLPFANGTGDPQQDYIADGLTASVTSDLSRIRDAFVVAAATAFAYKGKPVDLRQLATDLGVRFVLQGSVQRGGDKIRINAQLADTQTSAQLWAETFEGDPANLFALQDQVTARIGNSIGREMVVLAARESETRNSNPRAADLILRASAAYYKPQSLKNWQQIEDWLRQALELDPQNVSAIIGLARALTVQAYNFGHQLAPEEKEKKYAEGRDWALKAKELVPDNPLIYGTLALYAVAHDDFPAQRRAVETWLALDPKNPMAYNFQANVEIFLGNYRKAIDLLNQGTALDPRHPNVLLALTYVRAHFSLGDDDATIEWAQRALGLNSRFSEAHVYLAMAYALKGDDARAREAVANLLRLDPTFKLAKFRAPQSSRPAAHNAVYAEKILPAGRKAGLPE